jgi:hypothetical protein
LSLQRLPDTMVSYGLILLVQIACMLHAGRTGRPYFWFMIILFVPGLGILAYLAVEVIPGLLRGRTAARLSWTVSVSLDPTRQYREFARAVETLPSVANLRALADNASVSGVMTRPLTSIRARSQGGMRQNPTRCSDSPWPSFERAMPTRPARPSTAFSRRTRLSTPPKPILAARILEAEDRLPEALSAYERLSATYPGEEAKGRMALLLQRTGAEQRARAIFAEIRKSVERGPAFYRQAQREWYEIARRYA